jgi:hypothetical protein
VASGNRLKASELKAIMMTDMSKSTEEMVAKIEDMERLWNDANLLAPEFKLIIGVEGKSLQVLPRERWLSVLPHHVIQSYEITDMLCLSGTI